MLISSDRRGNRDSEVNSAPSLRHTAHRGWGCAGSRALLVLRPRLSLLGEASSGGLHGGLWAGGCQASPRGAQFPCERHSGDSHSLASLDPASFSLNKYLLSSYCDSGSVLGAWYTPVKIRAPWSPYSKLGRQAINSKPY